MGIVEHWGSDLQAGEVKKLLSVLYVDGGVFYFSTLQCLLSVCNVRSFFIGHSLLGFPAAMFFRKVSKVVQ